MICYTLLQWDISLVSALARGTQSSVFRGEYALSDPEGSWLIWTEVTAPSSWLDHPHANEDAKFSKFDWPKRHCLDWSESNLSDWSELHSSHWMGQASVILVEIDSRKPLLGLSPMAETQHRQAVQCKGSEWFSAEAGRLHQRFSMKSSLCERPWAEMTARLCLFLSPVSHQEHYFVGVFPPPLPAFTVLR